MSSLHLKLNQLSLTTMSRQLDQIVTDAASKNLGFAQALETLTDIELDARNGRAIERRFRLSRLHTQHSIDSFHFKHHKSRMEAKNRIVRLLDLDFLHKGTSVVLIGNPGVGKTFLAKVIGWRACQANQRAFYIDDLLVGLFRAQPIAALDALCAGSAEELQQGIRILKDVRARKYVLGFVPQDELLDWCGKEPAARYPAIASVLISVHRPGEKGPLQWTSLALQLLEKAIDPGEVLQEFVAQFSPADGLIGSQAGILEDHEKLLDDLNSSPHLAGAVAQARVRLHEEIDFRLQLETSVERVRDERFE
jgi:IstB-like ATP binding protein